MELYLSLGTNLGDRRKNINEAIKRLDAAIGIHFSRLSSIDESKSWGFEGPAFLDCVAVYDVGIPEDVEKYGEKLLSVCKNIEKELGREEVIEYDKKGGRIYHDRPIDIDILFIGKSRFRTDDLTVPHPLIRQRDFIMKPLLEVASDEIKAAFKEIFQ